MDQRRTFGENDGSKPPNICGWPTRIVQGIEAQKVGRTRRWRPFLLGLWHTGPGWTTGQGQDGARGRLVASFRYQEVDVCNVKNVKNEEWQVDPMPSDMKTREERWSSWPHVPSLGLAWSKVLDRKRGRNGPSKLRPGAADLRAADRHVLQILRRQQKVWTMWSGRLRHSQTKSCTFACDVAWTHDLLFCPFGAVQKRQAHRMSEHDSQSGSSTSAGMSSKHWTAGEDRFLLRSAVPQRGGGSAPRLLRVAPLRSRGMKTPNAMRVN